jgi:hypothetical protein
MDAAAMKALDFWDQPLPAHMHVHGYEWAANYMESSKRGLVHVGWVRFDPLSHFWDEKIKTAGGTAFPFHLDK